MARSVLVYFFSIFTLLALVGCATVPALDGSTKVPVSAVVSRIKCDLQRELAVRANDPSGKYEFLKHWAAKVHLTLAVDDTASLNPGATVINPLANSQSFSLGVGAGLSTESVRQADMEFLLSFAEISKELSNPANLARYQFCAQPDGLLLESDLRLNEVFDAALAPVRDGLLTYGNHPPPTGTSVSPITAQEEKNLSQTVDKLKSKAAEIRVSYNGDQSPFENRKTNVQKQMDSLQAQSKQIVENIVKPLSELSVNIDPKCAAAISQAKNEAVVSSALVFSGTLDLQTARTLADLDAALKKVNTSANHVAASAKLIIRDLRSCSAVDYKKPAKTPLYDPIDLIAQTVNFYITLSGSVTPTWKLVRVSAPLAPTFASASRKDTHTLILTFGRPEIKPDGTPQASAAMTNQVLSSLLTQAVQSAPAFRQ